MHSSAPKARASIGLDFGIQRFPDLVALCSPLVHCPRRSTRNGRRRGVRPGVDRNCRRCSSPGRIAVVVVVEDEVELVAAAAPFGDDAFADLARPAPVAARGNDSRAWLTTDRMV